MKEGKYTECTDSSQQILQFGENNGSFLTI